MAPATSGSIHHARFSRDPRPALSRPLLEYINVIPCHNVANVVLNRTTLEILVAEYRKFNEAQKQARRAGENIANTALSWSKSGRAAFSSVSERARKLKQQLDERKDDTPDPYDEAVAEYNAVFTSMSDNGM